MNDNVNPTYIIRKLWPVEQDMFRDHLLRLDPIARQERFAHAVSDEFLREYAAHMRDAGSIVYAYVENGEVRGAAELKKLGSTWGRDAEAALSVEESHRGRGIGSELVGRIIRSARNRGVHALYMSCLASNTKMQAIARKHDAELRIEFGEVIGEIVPKEPNYFSLAAEAFEDRIGFMMTVLELQSKSIETATSLIDYRRAS